MASWSLGFCLKIRHFTAHYDPCVLQTSKAVMLCVFVREMSGSNLNGNNGCHICGVVFFSVTLSKLQDIILVRPLSLPNWYFPVTPPSTRRGVTVTAVKWATWSYPTEVMWAVARKVDETSAIGVLRDQQLWELLLLLLSMTQQLHLLLGPRTVRVHRSHTPCRTPPNEWSARNRSLYLHNT